MRHFSEEEKQRAVNLYFNEGLTTQETVNKLGYPTRQNLERWLSHDPRYGSGFRHGYYPLEKKVKAVEMYHTGQHTLNEIAEILQLGSYSSIMIWVKIVQQLGYDGLIPRKKSAAMPKPKPPEIPSDLEALRQRCEELELDNAILRETIDILKKDPGVDPRGLSNREKTQVIGALKTIYPLSQLMNRLRIGRSSYYYHIAKLNRPDPFSLLRQSIVEIFEESRRTYGYRRVWKSLQNQGIRLSEKVVRRLMAQEGLKIVKSRRHYSSYKGEITPAPANELNRDFHAERPNEKWLTDITEMAAADGKVYLSPVIDCFDGLVVTWKMSRNPNAQLTDGMLNEAISCLPVGRRPILHTDRGVHYRWQSWIQIMDQAGMTRSMSRKACTPDNAACEGFFGRLKNEMYYGHNWQKQPVSQLMRAVDDYINWYNEFRIKMSLGGRSPMDYRRYLNLA